MGGRKMSVAVLGSGGGALRVAASMEPVGLMSPGTPTPE